MQLIARYRNAGFEALADGVLAFFDRRVDLQRPGVAFGPEGGPEADTDGDGKTDPIETSLEWGVRSLGKRVSVNAEGDLPAKAVADVFPAYDDDGGLLLVLTPEG